MENSKIGSTGNFSDGKLNKYDEGELAFGVVVEKGRLILFFNKPVIWLGFTKENVEDLITLLSDEIKNL